MAGERRSLQQRIRERQQAGFVGRQGQVVQYRENLEFSAGDERRRFLFNVHGDARTSAPDHRHYAAVRDHQGGKRAALSEARKILRQACHILSELGDDALTLA
jgi:hypothetical protein